MSSIVTWHNLLAMLGGAYTLLSVVGSVLPSTWRVTRLAQIVALDLKSLLANAPPSAPSPGDDK